MPPRAVELNPDDPYPRVKRINARFAGGDVRAIFCFSEDVGTGIMAGVRDTLYDLTRDERRAAVKAFRRVPVRVRLEVGRRADRGQPHPDATVAAVAEQWSRAMLRRAWWTKVPGWLQPLVWVLYMLFGWWVGGKLGIALISFAALGFVLSLIEWDLRRTARKILMAAEAHPSASPSGDSWPLRALAPQERGSGSRPPFEAWNERPPDWSAPNDRW